LSTPCACVDPSLGRQEVDEEEEDEEEEEEAEVEKP